MKIIKYIFLSLFVVSTLTSCSKWVEGDDVKISPNSAADATADIILSHAMVASISAHEGNNARYANMFTQHFRGIERQHSGYDSYIMNSQNFQWNIEYQAVIHQANLVIAKSTVANNQPMIGVAKVLKAWTFGTLTSLYGDIPFTEADQYETIREPKYDAQATVYAGVQTLLDEAITSLAGNGTISGDILFSGDVAKWTAVAHTLKARYYLHTKDYANAVTQATSGVTGTANNLLATHANGATLSDRNLWNDFVANQRAGDYGVSSTKPSFLAALIKTGGAKNNTKTNESARYAAFFTADASGNATGMNTGSTSSIFGRASSFPLVTYEENQLIAAEANARLSNDAAALTALNNVRTALAAQFTAGTYTAYTSTDTEVSTNANLLAEIIRERYVTLTGQIEVFNDLRRTKNAIGITAVSGSTLPGRFLYPSTEEQANATNLPSVSLFDVLTVFQ